MTRSNFSRLIDADLKRLRIDPLLSVSGGDGLAKRQRVDVTTLEGANLGMSSCVCNQVNGIVQYTSRFKSESLFSLRRRLMCKACLGKDRNTIR
jgi:hypothetical protein